MLGPFIFLGSLIKIKNLEFNRNKKVLLVFSLPIFFIVFFEAVIVRANANWAAPALISFFVFLYVSSKKESIYMNLNLFFNFIFCIIFFLLIATNYPSKIFERIIGLNNFAEYVYSEGSKNNITKQTSDIGESDILAEDLSHLDDTGTVKIDKKEENIEVSESNTSPEDKIN